MLTHDLRGLDAYGDVVAGPEMQAQLDAKLVELEAAHKDALSKFKLPWYVPGWTLQQIQDALPYGAANGRLASAFKTVQEGMDLLEGDLYQAVIGEHVFPLDVGDAPDPVAALASWNQIAGDVQAQLTGVLGYLGKWGPLPAIKYAAGQVANPLNWPWWLQLAAALAIYTYVRPLLGLLPSRRK